MFNGEDDDYDPMDSGVERGPSQLQIERDRYRAALESIRSIPGRIGCSPDAANEAVRIAKNALE